MPKAKLRFPVTNPTELPLLKKKLAVAAEYCNVKLFNAVVDGNELIVECSSGDIQNFVNMDRTRMRVKGNELDPTPSK